MPPVHVSGWCEDPREHEENLCRHRENMQTSLRRPGNRTHNLLPAKRQGQVLHHCAARIIIVKLVLKLLVKNKSPLWLLGRVMVHRGVALVFADALLSVFKMFISRVRAVEPPAAALTAGL